MTNVNNSITNALTALLTQDAEFAFLMGSAGTERFQASSDIDVAVFWKSTCAEERRNHHLRSLEEKLSRDFDLVSLNNIDEIFARQVLETGRLLFCNSNAILLNWKMEKMSKYPDFKTSRKIIEDQILKRKRYV